MSTSSAIRKRNFLKAFPRKNYHISRTCIDIGIRRQTYYDWMEADPDFKADIEALEEADIDDAEDSLRTLRKGIPKRKADGTFDGWISKPDVTANIFYLKTKGRKRGYEETTKVKLDGNLNTKFSDMSEDALDAKIEELKAALEDEENSTKETD